MGVKGDSRWRPKCSYINCPGKTVILASSVSLLELATHIPVVMISCFRRLSGGSSFILLLVMCKGRGSDLNTPIVGKTRKNLVL